MCRENKSKSGKHFASTLENTCPNTWKLLPAIRGGIMPTQIPWFESMLTQQLLRGFPKAKKGSLTEHWAFQSVGSDALQYMLENWCRGLPASKSARDGISGCAENICHWALRWDQTLDCGDSSGAACERPCQAPPDHATTGIPLKKVYNLCDLEQFIQIL